MKSLIVVSSMVVIGLWYIHDKDAEWLKNATQFLQTILPPVLAVANSMEKAQ